MESSETKKKEKSGTPQGRITDLVKDRKIRFAFRRFFESIEREGKYTEPFCQHFSVCGGCLLQHIPYDEQIKLKVEMVKREFGKNGLDFGLDEFFPAENTKFYRNRMDYAVFSPQGKGDVFIGLREYGKWWRTVDIKECYLLSKDTVSFLSAVREFLTEKNIPGYDPVSGKGQVRYVVIREGKNTGRKLIIILTTDDSFPFDDFFAFMSRKFPDVSFAHAVSDSPANVSYGDVIDMRGKELTEKVLGFEFKIPPFSFFQTNTEMAQKLVGFISDYIKQWDGKFEDLADFYSGVGLFSICLSDSFGKIYGIEIDEDAVFYAEQNAIANGVDNARFVRGRVEEYARRVSAEVIIVDPPRAGLGKKVAKAILGIKRAKKLIYVSCNAESFAKDLKILLRDFKVDAIFGFDFFPHTKHFELLAFLSR